jgi:diguanylate cyclase (GGDEF)-like protein
VATALAPGGYACVTLLGLDHFEAYNHSRGRPAGDRLLRSAVAAWRTVVREGDVLARCGGEEFGLLLPRCDLESALKIAQRLAASVPDGQTASIGLAAWDGTETPERLMARVDVALYDAKQSGRDRIAIAGS